MTSFGAKKIIKVNAFASKFRRKFLLPATKEEHIFYRFILGAMTERRLK